MEVYAKHEYNYSDFGIHCIYIHIIRTYTKTVIVLNSKRNNNLRNVKNSEKIAGFKEARELPTAIKRATIYILFSNEMVEEL